MRDLEHFDGAEDETPTGSTGAPARRGTCASEADYPTPSRGALPPSRRLWRLPSRRLPAGAAMQNGSSGGGDKSGTARGARMARTDDAGARGKRTMCGRRSPYDGKTAARVLSLTARRHRHRVRARRVRALRAMLALPLRTPTSVLRVGLSATPIGGGGASRGGKAETCMSAFPRSECAPPRTSQQKDGTARRPHQRRRLPRYTRKRRAQHPATAQQARDGARGGRRRRADMRSERGRRAKRPDARTSGVTTGGDDGGSGKAKRTSTGAARSAASADGGTASKRGAHGSGDDGYSCGAIRDGAPRRSVLMVDPPSSLHPHDARKGEDDTERRRGELSRASTARRRAATDVDGGIEEDKRDAKTARSSRRLRAHVRHRWRGDEVAVARTRRVWIKQRRWQARRGCRRETRDDRSMGALANICARSYVLDPKDEDVEEGSTDGRRITPRTTCREGREESSDNFGSGENDAVTRH
ncbi:hypothetical protein FB451DRAFT_1195234 [Mycena latifolia]|nr:hypothetical protein FB451DRAFT_1195234 [Mycena latifolia]